MRGARQTIFALSSGQPPAAIAIIRVSGPGAADAVRSIAGGVPTPRLATVRPFRGTDGTLIDRGLLLWFPRGASVTGEDLAEFHCHGARAVVARMLAVLAEQPDLRLAEPGEFSRRALLNGRLSLVEAEGLSDLLLSETEVQRRAALDMFDGALGERIEGWRRELLAVAAMVEALIDMDGEADVAETASEAEVQRRLAALAGDLRRVLDGTTAEEMRYGFSVVIAGPPNSGKSSLLNAIAGREAALVTPVAGTTRDLIEVSLAVGDHRVRLVDTAGLRQTDDPVEALGVERAERVAAAADLLLWLGDEQGPVGTNVLPLHARCDVAGREDAGGRLAVSSREGTGITRLLSRVADFAAAQQKREDGLVLNQRQRSASSALLGSVIEAEGANDLLLVADYLRDALQTVDQLSGRAGLPSLLDAIFSSFCVGK